MALWRKVRPVLTHCLISALMSCVVSYQVNRSKSTLTIGSALRPALRLPARFSLVSVTSALILRNQLSVRRLTLCVFQWSRS